MKRVLYTQVIVFAVFAAVLMAAPFARAQEISADFSGGSMLIGNDTRACVAGLAGSMRYGGGEDITSNLQGHWKFDESSGNAVDSSGNGYTGTITGATWQSTGGIIDGALQFAVAGTDQAGIGDPATNNLEINGDMTIGGWVKTATNGSKTKIILAQDLGAHDINYEIDILSTGIVRFHHGNGAGSSWDYDSVSTIDNDTWHHVMFVADYPNGYMYIDGALDKAVTMSADITENSGGGYTSYDFSHGNASFSYEGRLDDWRIYNRALTAAEINALPGHTTDITSNLLGHWKMDETSGTNVNDDTANGNDGTFVNTPTWNSTGGQLDGALDFDGTGDYVSVTNSGASLDIDGDMTIATWVKTSISNPNGAIIFFQDTGGATNNYNIGLESGSPYFDHGTAGGGEIFYAAGTVNDNNWHHVAFVSNFVDNATNDGFFYVDGVLDSSINLQYDVVNFNSSDFKISTNGSTYSFEGLMDDLRVYDRALTAGDIGALPGLGGVVQFCDGSAWTTWGN